MKRTAGRWRKRRRHISGQYDPPPPGAIQGRDRGKQRPGIGMGGMIENLLLTSHLHNLPEIHHRHIVADEAHNAEIMGDEKIGQSHLFLHIL